MDRTLTKPALIAMLCATADRTPDMAHGARALALELGERIGIAPRLIGTPAAGPRDTAYEQDLAENGGCLLEAGGQVEDALAGGDRPLLFAGDCAIAATTLRTVLRHRPEAMVLWLDAHPDFNTPATTSTGYLGGMGLSAACGRWDCGLLHDEPALDPSRVVMCGARDIDPGELIELEAAGVMRIEEPSLIAEALNGRAVFVHVDVDVLDPEVLRTRWPVPGGLTDGELHALLSDVVSVAGELIGAEITNVPSAGAALRVATALEPLLTGPEG
jgi:arginase